MFTVVFEERGEPEESLTRRLHFMRCVQNAQAKDRQGVQLKDLDNGVLAVLPWHCNAPAPSGPPTVLVALHPRFKHALLPLIGHQPVGGCNLNSVFSVSGITGPRMIKRRSLGSVQHYAPPFVAARRLRISSILEVVSGSSDWSPVTSSSSRDTPAARAISGAISRPESDASRVFSA